MYVFFAFHYSRRVTPKRANKLTRPTLA